MSKRDQIIARAARHEIELQPSDIKDEDGVLTIDDMPAGEWIDAMTMD